MTTRESKPFSIILSDVFPLSALSALLLIAMLERVKDKIFYCSFITFIKLIASPAGLAELCKIDLSQVKYCISPPIYLHTNTMVGSGRVSVSDHGPGS